MSTSPSGSRVAEPDAATTDRGQLHRGLSQRHIMFIALGTAVGTGLFYGSAGGIQAAGPGVILSFLVAGAAVFLVMRALGEMTLREPVSGSFAAYASRYLGPFAGYVTGWTFVFELAVVIVADTAAITTYMAFWFPGVPAWAWVAATILVVGLINFTHVGNFGEAEFWLTLVKVGAIVAMIFGGVILLFTGASTADGTQASLANLVDHGGFLPHGFTGLVMMMAIIMFSFGGLELVGITAAEADNPEQSIPKATNQVIYRILIFYVGSLAVLLSLLPWSRVTADTSPFVLIFHELGDTFVANALNIVVLTAALSVYNSCVYCNSRMLFGLAQQGNAPKALMSVDKRGVPVNTILVSAVVTALCVLINYFAPESAFGLLMALVVSALVINWAMISLAHMKFRRAKQQQGVVTRFPALLYPLGNWICLLFMAGVLVIMLMTPGMAISVYLIPVWIAVLGVGYLFKQKTASAIKA